MFYKSRDNIGFQTFFCLEQLLQSLHSSVLHDFSHLQSAKFILFQCVIVHVTCREETPSTQLRMLGVILLEVITCSCQDEFYVKSYHNMTNVCSFQEHTKFLKKKRQRKKTTTTTTKTLLDIYWRCHPAL